MTNRRPTTATSDASPGSGRTGRLRPTLWLLLIISLTLNAAASTIGATAVSVIFGLVTLACATGLVVDHYRHRDG